MPSEETKMNWKIVKQHQKMIEKLEDELEIQKEAITNTNKIPLKRIEKLETECKIFRETFTRIGGEIAFDDNSIWDRLKKLEQDFKTLNSVLWCFRGNQVIIEQVLKELIETLKLRFNGGNFEKKMVSLESKLSSVAKEEKESPKQEKCFCSDCVGYAEDLKKEFVEDLTKLEEHIRGYLVNKSEWGIERYYITECIKSEIAKYSKEEQEK